MDKICTNCDKWYPRGISECGKDLSGWCIVDGSIKEYNDTCKLFEPFTEDSFFIQQKDLTK